MRTVALIQSLNPISNENQRLIAQRIAILLLILVFIQVLNRFLIVSGSTLETTILLGNSNPRFWVGLYQQLIQATAGILLCRWLFNKNISELGINFKNRVISLRYFGIYVVIWLAVVLFYVLSTQYIFPPTWLSLKSVELPPPTTILATLFFQSTFPGLGEEIFFRGFIITLLTLLVFPLYKKKPAGKIGIIALSSIYFATAHIYFTFSPLQITHFDALQIVTALGCGAFYAAAFLKTNSLLAPFLAHNFSNTTTTICGYIISSL